MSVSRAVAAAQRRRAGPPQVDVSRGPTPSIHSSQLFSQSSTQNQMKPGSAKISGQKTVLAQQNMVQQALDQRHENLKASSDSKISIPQAITLITLRLGKVETHLQQLSEDGLLQPGSRLGLELVDNENTSVVDKSFLESIMARLESLEKRPSNTSSQPLNNTEMTLVKQQMEVMKPALITTKNLSVSTSKEVKELKEQIERLKRELEETKQMLQQLESLSVDNSQRIIELSMGVHMDTSVTYEEGDAVFELLNDSQETDSNHLEQRVVDLEGDHNAEDSVSSLQIEHFGDYSSANLKDMIEEEFNENDL